MSVLRAISSRRGLAGWILLPGLALGVGGDGEQASREEPEPVVVAQRLDAGAKVGREVMQEAYARLGIPVSFELCPAHESLAALDEGRFDAQGSRIDGASRKYPQLVQVPIPISYLQGVAFSSRYNFPIRGWHSLRPYKIGIPAGIIFARQGTEGMDVREAETYEELLGWIQDGTVDVGVMQRINGQHALASGKYEGIHELEGVLETFFLYHYVHESRAELVPKLTPVLKEMLLDGTTRRIRRETIARMLRGDE